jgi:putative ABC transport system permease protein
MPRNGASDCAGNWRKERAARGQHHVAFGLTVKFVDRHAECVAAPIQHFSAERFAAGRDAAQTVNPRIFGALLSGDQAQGARTVIVNESFARRVLGSRNAVGRYIRYRFFEERRGDPTFVAEVEPWYEIVGVVPDLATTLGTLDPKAAAVYHPVRGDTYPLNIAIHAPGDPLAVAQRVRMAAAAVDPGLRLYGVAPLTDMVDVEVDFLRFWMRLAFMVGIIALVLSLTGVYAVTAYAVSRRTREIGIRVALGADARRIVFAIFRQPFVQVMCGIILGVGVIGLLYEMAGGFTVRGALRTAAYATVMLVVCMVACAAPTRRALRIQPTEAMRVDG